MGQLVQVPGGWHSARQLLWSKAETEVLKCLATAQNGSNPKGCGTRMREWGSGAEGNRQLWFPWSSQGWHVPASLIPPPLGLEMCRFKTGS